MPVIAVAGIIAGGATLAAGTAGILGTIAAVGSIVGGIGALTGNKTLMKVGMVAGLVGGVGAFAQSQGWLASANAMDTAANAANGTSTIDALQNTASGAEVTLAADPALASTATGSTAAASTIPDASVMESAGLASAESNIGQALGQQSAETAKALGAAPVESAAAAGGGLMDAVETAGGLPGHDAVHAGALMPEQAFGAVRDLPVHEAAHTLTGREKIMDLFNTVFRDDKGKLDKNMLSLAGNFVGGMFDSGKLAQAELLEERAETERQQRANANAVPTMNFKRTGPAPFRPAGPTYNPVRTGLMNAR